jgi:hypothetical protein
VMECLSSECRMRPLSCNSQEERGYFLDEQHCREEHSRWECSFRSEGCCNLKIERYIRTRTSHFRQMGVGLSLDTGGESSAAGSHLMIQLVLFAIVGQQRTASGWVGGGTESRADERCSNLRVGDMTAKRTIIGTQNGLRKELL